MRFFGTRKNTDTKPSHRLFQIWTGEAGSNVNEAVERFINDLWETLREIPRSKITSELPAYCGLEIQALRGEVCFYLWLPESVIDQLRDKLKLIYPEVIMAEPLDDYSRQIGASETAYVGELGLAKDEPLPIISNASDTRWPAILRLLENVQVSDRVWLQVLVRPLSGAWKNKIFKMITNKNDGTINQLYEHKIASNGFRAQIRLVYISRDDKTAKQNIKVLARAFNQNTQSPNNDFKLKSTGKSLDRRLEYYTRLFIDKGLLLNTAEVASIISFSCKTAAEAASGATKAKQPSTFDRLLAEAETTHTSSTKTKPQTAQNKFSANHKPTTSKRAPRGVIALATKSNTKKGIGKVATKKTQDASQPDEVTVKLH